MGYAARVMRGLIIDHARSRNAIKRGGEFEITSLKTDPGQYYVDARKNSRRSAMPWINWPRSSLSLLSWWT